MNVRAGSITAKAFSDGEKLFDDHTLSQKIKFLMALVGTSIFYCSPNFFFAVLLLYHAYLGDRRILNQIALRLPSRRHSREFYEEASSTSQRVPKRARMKFYN